MMTAGMLAVFGVSMLCGGQTGADEPAIIPAPKGPAALAKIPSELPDWIRDPRTSEIAYRRGSYNFAVVKIDALSRDLNGVAVGHAMAYEDLVTGNPERIETDTFARIERVLARPPRLMPGERFISPTFASTYGYLEKVFDWTHVLHAQTIDVLASPNLSQSQKERELTALWRFYKTAAPYSVTGLPLNMDYLDSQAYSGAFRQRFPKVNGLFWGYHWLQGAVYDMLWTSRSVREAITQYEVVGKRYREVELRRTDRDFMPMFAEVSPLFARRFPEMANAFDNLHMLHDMVNDILATDWMSDAQREDQIKRAIWLVSDEAHRGRKAGDFTAGDFLHDHRFMRGQPGMGMMKMSTPGLMFMPGMGWMRMDECAHCSMPLSLDDRPVTGGTVSAEGWTMEVRCVLCARDMAAQVEGQAILRLHTEDPDRPLVLISDDEGNLSANVKGAVFLEIFGPHAGCSSWSRAFTSRAAYDAFLNQQDPDDESWRDARPLDLVTWSQLSGGEPDTYEPRRGPVDNPYRPALVPPQTGASQIPTPSCCAGGKS